MPTLWGGCAALTQTWFLKKKIEKKVLLMQHICWKLSKLLNRVYVNITSFNDWLHKYSTDSWVQRAGGQTGTSWGEWQIHDSLELCLTTLMLLVSVWRWRRSLSTSSSRVRISHRAMQAPKCPLELCLDKENSFRGWTDFLLPVYVCDSCWAPCVCVCLFVCVCVYPVHCIMWAA